ncbi:MAG: Asp-tRNA(Asn)/Glu-tRNA(Gln) amidotransferase subunit GatB [Actinomycetota bacterium]
MTDVTDVWTHEGYELVCGLEVHVELATASKLFSPAANRFGDDPNTNIDPVCVGLPGTLPVLNRHAVELAIRLGLALECDIRPSIFARKNYFYPDMPKDFQISQYELPICSDGRLELPGGHVVGIERAHLEEDTGKTTHVGGGGRIHDATYSLVDYNRSGVPLLEIVSRPEVRTPDQAREYASELRAILLATDVSDARMEEGSMRVDANVSVRPIGSDELRTRCEIKNLNSIRSLGRAIEYEAKRHIALYEDGEAPVQETRHWDEDGGRTHTLRSKEEAYDYRYFADPDLPPLTPDPAWIERIAADLPPLPAARRHQLADAAGVAASEAALVVERGLDGLCLATIAEGADAGRVLVHATQNLSDGADGLAPVAFAALVGMEVGGDLTATQAKQVLAEMVETGRGPAEIAADRGFEAMDSGDLHSIVDEVVAASPDEWQRFVEGDQKVMGFFVGQVMKRTQGQADGKAVSARLRELAQA